MKAICLSLVFSVVFCGTLCAQNVGPDIIVGAITGTSSYGSVGDIAAFALGTTSCNAGDAVVPWQANNPSHPVIALNIYRLEDGKFEQVGQSWLKHGFGALQQNACSPCQSGGSFSSLGVGCSDPYGASTNGSQSGLGPRSEVNAFDGVFPYPFTSPSIPATIGRRLQAHHSDIDPALHPNARYFSEAQYISPHDAQAGNGNNNASYREVEFSPNGGSFNISYTSGATTQQLLPGIQAWQDVDPSVQIQNIDIPGDGRMILGFKTTAGSGGLVNYEFALQNLNSDRSAGSFSVAIDSGATVSGIGFHDCSYHSGETYDETDWAGSYNGNAVTWATDSFATNSDANALRWSTIYNFRFSSDAAPSQVTIGLFKPGTPSDVTVNVGPPAFTIAFPNGVPDRIDPDQTFDVDVATTNIAGAPDPATAMVVVSVNGAAPVSSPMTDLGGGNFQATLPASPCFSSLEWYVGIEPMGGGAPINEPSAAEPVQTSVAPENLAVVLSDDFETDQGWTVDDDPGLSTGTWERGVPVGGGDRGDPATDSDGSGQCFVTDNQDGNWDVDGGATRLTSPAYDLTGLPDAQISFDFWYDIAWGGYPQDDVFNIELSDDDGANWVLVESYNSSTGQWVHRDFLVGNHVALTSQVRIRFTASDFGSGTVVEAGVDALQISVCPVLNETVAAGNVGSNGAGGPHDVLLVNGSNGGGLREVTSGLNQPLTFAVTQPPSANAPSGFAIFGMIGIPGAGDITTLPLGIGDTCITPCPLDAQNPSLFTLADNFGLAACQPLIGSTAGPWSFSHGPGLGFPLQITLQGVIVDPTGSNGLSVTNAVILTVQ